MAIRYRLPQENAFDRLMNETLPRIISQQAGANDRKLEREEAARRFDKQMDAQAETELKAQKRWDDEFKLKEDQYDKSNAIENRKINLTEDKILFDTYTKYDTIQERQTALEKGGLAFKTDIYKNKSKVELANLDKVSAENKKTIELLRKIDPQLAQIAGANVNHVNMEIDSDVLNFLKIKGAANATRGTALITALTAADKRYTEDLNSFRAGLITQEQFDATNSKPNFDAAQQALNDYIKGDPALGSASTVDDAGGSTVIPGAPDGSIASPYSKDNLPASNEIKPGDVMEVGDGEEKVLFISGEDGMWTELPTETPATPEYIVSPSERQGLEEGFVGMDPKNLGFLERAADDYAVVLNYSPKQSFLAVKNFKKETDKALNDLMENREKGRGGQTISATEETASPEYTAAATRLQDLIQNGYNLYLRTDPNTKGGKKLRKDIKGKLISLRNRARNTLKEPTGWKSKSGRLFTTGAAKGEYTVMSQNQDLVELLDSIEF